MKTVIMDIMKRLTVIKQKVEKQQKKTETELELQQENNDL